MLLYRSFVVGLLGACCLLLAERPRPEVRLIAQQPPPVAVPEVPVIVDVAAGIGPAVLAQALHVPGVQPEDVAPVFAQHKLESGTYLDLMVGGRRVLVLAH